MGQDSSLKSVTEQPLARGKYVQLGKVPVARESPYSYRKYLYLGKVPVAR
jgi:hypothetical protein